jgi:thiamine pyrophosphate-dependent acetolactate synthase large subunit-like protein
MTNNTLRESARTLLDGEISRRTFLRRLTALGIAAPGASTVLNTLLPAKAMAAQDGTRRLRGLTGGELMVETLLDWKVPYVFGLGGSEEVGFLDALVDRDGLHYVLALHEGSAMAMADGFARSSGTTGFVNLHSIAGASYALGPMVNAFKDRSPLVVTVGRQGTDMRGGDAFLEATNLHTLPRDYARWTWDVLRSDSIPETLRRAFMISTVPPEGPSFLTFSKDLWEERVDEAEIVAPARSPVSQAFQPEAGVIKELADRLLHAELPLIVTGRELSQYGGTQELVMIAELLGAPVMGDIPASHSPIAFPSNHPQYGGLFTLDEGVSTGFDLFWSVGGTMFTQFRKPAQPLVSPSVEVVHSSIEGGRIGRNYPVDLAVAGNPKLILQALVLELQQRDLPGSKIAARREQVVARTTARRSGLMAMAKKVWNETPIAPERLAVELNNRLDADATVVCELATSDFFVWRYLDFKQSDPGRHHITSGGGCLGWGLGAAIGAKMGRPDQQTALLVGDGSFQFGVQALWSAARYKVPLAVIIWNNLAYQANRRALHQYGGRSATSGKYTGCYLGSPTIDNVQIARGYGVDGEKVSDPEKLGEAIDRCFKTVSSGYPYVLDVSIQPRFPGADSTWFDEFSIA